MRVLCGKFVVSGVRWTLAMLKMDCCKHMSECKYCIWNIRDVDDTFADLYYKRLYYECSLWLAEMHILAGNAVRGVVEFTALKWTHVGYGNGQRWQPWKECLRGSEVVISLTANSMLSSYHVICSSSDKGLDVGVLCAQNQVYQRAYLTIYICSGIQRHARGNWNAN
jgi:hypothetical protein